MTAARTSAQNAAMEALLEAHATELKLPTVKARFRAMATEATREQQTLRPRPTASDSATAARAQPEHFRHHQQPTRTDERWGHFKRRRWGHCKWPLEVPRFGGHGVVRRLGGLLDDDLV